MYYSNLIINLIISIALTTLYFYVTGKTYSIPLLITVISWFILYIPIAIYIESDNLQVFLILLALLSHIGAYSYGIKNKM